MGKNKIAQTTGKKIFIGSLIVIALVFALYFIIAAVSVVEISVPINGTNTTNNYFEYAANFSTDYLNGAIWNYDGINNSIDDEYLNFMSNFDNRSPLGENNSIVKDSSRYGNDGTVSSGLLWNATGGKNNGAFEFDGTGGHKITINTESINNTLSGNNLTILFWYKAKDTRDWYEIIQFPNSSNRIEDANGGIGYVNLCNATWTCKSLYPYYGSIDTWGFFALTYNGSRITLYNNGALEDYSDAISGSLATGKSLMYIGSGSSGEVNGTMDDLYIYNRSLSSSEIREMYYLQLTKYDSQNWSIYINQSLNTSSQIINSTNPTKTIEYQFCVSNLTESNCSSTRTITSIIKNTTLVANFTEDIGEVRENFYGLNVQSPSRVVGNVSLDTDCNGAGDTAMDTAWSQSILLDSKMNMHRYDWSIGSYYSGINNLGFEEWTNKTQIKYVDGYEGSTNLRSWLASTSESGTGIMLLSEDAHSGIYSLNMTSNGTGGSIFLYRGLGTNPNWSLGQYNISIWLKGTGTVVLKMGNATGIYSNFCISPTITLTSSWQYTSCSFNYTEINEATFVPYVSVEGIGPGESVLIDDFNITYNGDLFRWWRSGNDTAYKNMIQWSYDNNQYLLLIVGYMPPFLANWSDPNCEGYGGISTGDGSCMPFDWDIWEEIVKDFLIRITNNDTRLMSNMETEIWNEPYGNLGNYSYDSVPLAIAYAQLANHSIDAIHEVNLDIPVCVPSGYQMTTTPNIFIASFTNLSGKFNCITAHPYSSNYKGTNNMYVFLKNITDTCINLGGGAGCYRIIASEWETYNKKNISNCQGDDFKAELAIAYQGALNWNPSNVSMQFYHYLDGTSYFYNRNTTEECTSSYSEWPSFWSSVSPAGLDNPYPTYYPPYNITSDMAHVCPAGSMVKRGYSLNTNLVITTCQENNYYGIIITNKGTDSENVSIDLSGIYPYYSIMNYKTKEIYRLDSNKNVNVGVLDQNKIYFLTSGQEPTITFEDPTPANNSPTGTSVNIVANISSPLGLNTSSWIDMDRRVFLYWSMDEYNETGVFDNSSYGLFGTFYNISSSNITEGIRGKGIEFAGGDASNLTDYIKSPTTTNTYLPNGTISMWVDIYGASSFVGNNQERKIAIGNSRPLIYGTNQFAISWDSAKNSSNMSNSYPGGCTIGYGIWKYLTLTWVNAGSGTNNSNLSYYINGASCRNVTNWNLPLSSSGTIQIGAYGGVSPLNGTVDEVIIFNRTLSVGEIEALYNSQSSKHSSSFNSLSAGWHNYTVYAIDEYGNTNSSYRRFLVDIFPDHFVTKKIGHFFLKKNQHFKITS